MNDRNNIDDSSTTKKVKKGTILQHTGDKIVRAFFVKKGLLKSYFIDDEGKEHIFMFAPEEWLITDVNLLSNKDSNYTAFDSADYNSIMKTSGCMIFGATTVKNAESETSLSAALKNNLEKTLLAGGFDLTTAQGAASVIVGGTVLYETVPGLMDNIEYGFDTLAALTGGAIVHRGIYEDPDREKLVAYTIVGGLKSPKKRIEELKKFLKLK